jgi:hypothetical protein
VETAAFSRSLRVVAGAPLDGITPVRDGAAKLARSDGRRRLEERLLDPDELGRVALARGDEHRCRGRRDVPRRERVPRPGHPAQPSRHPDVLSCRRPRDAAPMDEPRGHGEVTIASERTPRIELGDPSEALRLERPADPLDLFELALELGVGGEPEVFTAELVEGSKRVHHPHAIERPFGGP